VVIPDNPTVIRIPLAAPREGLLVFSLPRVGILCDSVPSFGEDRVEICGAFALSGADDQSVNAPSSRPSGMRSSQS